MYYQTRRRRGKGIFLLLLAFLCAVAVGLGIGYAGVKLELIPNKIDAQPEPTATPLPLGSAAPTTIPEEENAAVSLSTIVPEEPESLYRSGFLVKAEDGDVCIFKIEPDGTTVYSHKIPVELSALRSEDKKRFLNGIHVENQQELLELVEDFSS